tara:strand:- start:81 stop:359 length:279 start_codon:yes stop_codon:yes gene_type:complete
MTNKTVLNCDTNEVTVTKLTDAELAAIQETTAEKSQNIRDRRDSLLKNSDWTQAADVPTAIKSNWTDYRQKLRDVPAQSGFPDSVTWPTEPS